MSDQEMSDSTGKCESEVVKKESENQDRPSVSVIMKTVEDARMFWDKWIDIMNPSLEEKIPLARLVASVNSIEQITKWINAFLAEIQKQTSINEEFAASFVRLFNGFINLWRKEAFLTALMDIDDEREMDQDANDTESKIKPGQVKKRKYDSSKRRKLKANYGFNRTLQKIAPKLPDDDAKRKRVDVEDGTKIPPPDGLLKTLPRIAPTSDRLGNSSDKFSLVSTKPVSSLAASVSVSSPSMPSLRLNNVVSGSSNLTASNLITTQLLNSLESGAKNFVLQLPGGNVSAFNSQVSSSQNLLLTQSPVPLQNSVKFVTSPSSAAPVKLVTSSSQKSPVNIVRGSAPAPSVQVVHPSSLFPVRLLPPSASASPIRSIPPSGTIPVNTKAPSTIPPLRVIVPSSLSSMRHSAPPLMVVVPSSKASSGRSVPQSIGARMRLKKSVSRPKPVPLLPKPPPTSSANPPGDIVKSSSLSTSSSSSLVQTSSLSSSSLFCVKLEALSPPLLEPQTSSPLPVRSDTSSPQSVKLEVSSPPPFLAKPSSPASCGDSIESDMSDLIYHKTEINVKLEPDSDTSHRKLARIAPEPVRTPSSDTVILVDDSVFEADVEIRRPLGDTPLFRTNITVDNRMGEGCTSQANKNLPAGKISLRDILNLGGFDEDSVRMEDLVLKFDETSYGGINVSLNMKFKN